MYYYLYYTVTVLDEIANTEKSLTSQRSHRKAHRIAHETRARKYTVHPTTILYLVDVIQHRHLRSQNRTDRLFRSAIITMQESPTISFWPRREARASLGKDNGLQPFSTKVVYAAVSTVLFSMCI